MGRISYAEILKSGEYTCTDGQYHHSSVKPYDWFSDHSDDMCRGCGNTRTNVGTPGSRCHKCLKQNIYVQFRKCAGERECPNYFADARKSLYCSRCATKKAVQDAKRPCPECYSTLITRNRIANYGRCAGCAAKSRVGEKYPRCKICNSKVRNPQAKTIGICVYCQKNRGDVFAVSVGPSKTPSVTHDSDEEYEYEPDQCSDTIDTEGPFQSLPETVYDPIADRPDNVDSNIEHEHTNI